MYNIIWLTDKHMLMSNKLITNKLDIGHLGFTDLKITICLFLPYLH